MPARSTQAGYIRDDRDPAAYVNLANDPAYASAGGFTVSAFGTEFAGSGTLVGSQWVLTAAHVFDSASGATFKVGDRTYTASHWVLHPKWNGNYRKGNDLALVKLSEPVNGVEPARVYRGARELGATATFVGTGRTGTGLGGPGTFDGVERAGQNVIDGTTGAKPNTYVARLTKKARTFVVDFDNPRDPGQSTLGSANPADLEFLISLGDSGGGAFADFGDGHGPVLVGVHSFGEMPDGIDDSDYGDITGHVRVSRSFDWIRQTMKRNGDPAAAASLLGRSLRDPSGRSAELSFLTGGPIVPEPGSALAVVWVAAAGLLRRRRVRAPRSRGVN